MRMRFDVLAATERRGYSSISPSKTKRKEVMKALRNACAVLACASLLLGQFGCSTTKTLLSSTKYSASAYNTDKEIKAESLALIDRAKDKAPYTGVAANVDQLMKKVDAANAAE